MTERMTNVFLTISAQEDNLGDIEIRQKMIDLVDHPYTRLHISRGGMSDDYVAAFRIPESARIYSSRVSQMRSFMSAALDRSACVVYPPGPYPINSFRAALKSGVAVALTHAVRWRGGVSITVGKSVRGAHPVARLAERMLESASTMYVARDRLTSSVLGRPVRSAPDIALLRDAEAPPTAVNKHDRSRVAISLRSDTALEDATLRSIARWAAEQGLELCFITQVRRDGARHAQLATAIGANHVEWGEYAHAEQMKRVQSAYESCRWVFTDRLHAAIFGMNRGAIPVALTTPGKPSKILDAMDGVMTVPNIELRGSVSAESLDAVLTWKDETECPRRVLDDLRQEIAALIAGSR